MVCTKCKKEFAPDEQRVDIQACKATPFQENKVSSTGGIKSGKTTTIVGRYKYGHICLACWDKLNLELED